MLLEAYRNDIRVGIQVDGDTVMSDYVDKYYPTVVEKYLQLIEEIFKELRSDPKKMVRTVQYNLTSQNAKILSKIFDTTFKIFTRHYTLRVLDEFPSRVYDDDRYFHKGVSYRLFMNWESDNPFIFSDLSIRQLMAIHRLEKPAEYTPEKHNQDFLDAAKAGEGTDVEFRVEDTTFKAHSWVLKRKAKDYFEPLISGKHTVPKTESGVLILKDVQKEVFEEIYCFLYTGTFRETTDVSKIIAIYEEADRFQIDGLKALAKSRLGSWLFANPLTKDNLAEVLTAAILYSDDYAMKACCVFAETNDENMKQFIGLVTLKNYAHLAQYVQKNGLTKLGEALFKKSLELVK